MAQHEVLFTVPQRPVGNCDIEFVIKRNGKRFGLLRISKGAIEWIQRDKTYGSKMSWKQFDQFVADRGAYAVR